MHQMFQSLSMQIYYTDIIIIIIYECYVINVN